MTPDDLLSLTMVSSEPLGNTEQNTLLVFLKFVIFVEIERKNDYNDNHASHNLLLIRTKNNSFVKISYLMPKRVSRSTVDGLP